MGTGSLDQIVKGQISEEEFNQRQADLDGKKSTNWVGMKALISPIKTQLLCSVAAVVFCSGLQLIPAVSIAQISLHYVRNHSLDSSYVWWWIIFGAVSLIAGHLIHIGVTAYCHKLEARFRRDLRRRITAKLNQIPLGWYDDNSSGHVKKIVRDDVAAIHVLVAHLPVDITTAIALTSFSAIYLFVYNWIYALGLFLFILFFLMIGSLLSGKNMKQNTETFFAAQSKMSQALVEMTHGISDVKNFGGSSRLFKRYETALAYLSTWTYKWMRQSGRGQSLMISVLTPGGLLLPLIVLGWLVITFTGAPVTILIPFFMVGMGFVSSLGTLLTLMQPIMMGAEAATRICDLLDVEPLPQPREPAAIPEGSIGVSLKEVSFGYNPERPVLNNISLEFPAGTITALVGPSGSGKTTVTRLIARFFDADEGIVSIGEINVRDIDEADLLAHLAIVEQDVSLTVDTVSANIALGNPAASEDEIIAAAKNALIHDRIQRLPNGYNTILGEADAHLSGGEKQRITLARAFLRKAPIVLLDEATAYADPHSEREIQQAISNLTAGRTVIVIAHRLPSIVGVDNIIVLDNGRVVEQGNHIQLLEAGGLYSQLWEAQQ